MTVCQEPEAAQTTARFKHLVHYSTIHDLGIRDGGVCWLKPVDHPNEQLNGKWARTSRVVDFSSVGGRTTMVETLNTIYRRAP